MIKGKRTKTLLTHFFLLLFSAFALFPFLWMAITSFKTKQEIYTVPATWLPASFSFTSYLKLLELNFFQYFFNSVFIATICMALVLFFTILAAYGFSRFNFPGKGALFSSSLMGQLLPASVMFMPLYMFLGKLLYDSYFTLIIIYVAILLPYAIWTLTAYFNGISTSLDEAAMIDGCSRMKLLFSVIVPPAMPGIVSVALYAFIVVWQEFLFALIFVNTVSKRTLPLALAAFRGQYAIEWGPLMAASLVTTLPLAIFFVFLQRRLVSGLTGGAVKE